MRNPRITVTAREAAALDRLLAAYVLTEEGDPGLEDLRNFYAKVHEADQDHAAYEAAFARPERDKPGGFRDPLGTACASCGHPRNFHEYADLRCTVKLDQHGFARCGCAYRTPHADQATTATRPNSGG